MCQVWNCHGIAAQTVLRIDDRRHTECSDQFILANAGGHSHRGMPQDVSASSLRRVLRGWWKGVVPRSAVCRGPIGRYGFFVISGVSALAKCSGFLGDPRCPRPEKSGRLLGDAGSVAVSSPTPTFRADVIVADLH